MNYSSTQKNKNESGFTILESIISIFILLTAITGPLVYVASGFKAAEQAKNQMIAYYLAAETIEEIKFYRDTHKSDSDWYKLGFTSLPVNSSTQNNFDWDATGLDSFRGCNNNNGTGDGHDCGKLFIEDSTGRYGYATLSGYTESIFERDVTDYVESPVNADEYIITVEVSWSDRGSTYEVEITEHIFDIHT